MATPHKVLFFDIETAPLLAHMWSLWQDYVPIDAIVGDSFMLSWAAKWAGQKQVKSDLLTGEEARNQQDHRIVESLADLIRQADVVVAHNADKFDVPVLNARLLKLDAEPLEPVRTIDTLKLAKKNFKLPSNKLDYLAEALGVGRKHKTDFDLWLDCYHGDEKALQRMDRYCRQDVRVLEGVYDALYRYVKGIPRLVEPDYDGEPACPRCGSHDQEKRGTDPTNAGTRQRWRCKACGKWHRSRRSTEKPRLATVPI